MVAPGRRSRLTMSASGDLERGFVAGLQQAASCLNAYSALPMLALVFERDAVKALKKLPAGVRANLRRHLEAIAANPHGRHGGFEPLAGDLAGLHQLRITRWRGRRARSRW